LELDLVTVRRMLEEVSTSGGAIELSY